MKGLFRTLLVFLTLSACSPKQVETLTVSPESVSFDAGNAPAQTISVSASGKWSVRSSDMWIKVFPLSGEGSGTISVSVEDNESAARTGTLTVGCGSLTSEVRISQADGTPAPVIPAPAAFDGTKRSSTTYQLLVYSFADSDGDGIGDFKGIEQKLDYLDALGVTAIWLSPIHPADSYHGYDVRDYFSVNPLYGSEDDFRSLIAKAHDKQIKIYLDYVLNHTGKGNGWFTQALSDPASPYRDYYFFSSNPAADYKNFPMLNGTAYSPGEWKSVSSGSPRLIISKTDEAPTSGNSDWNIWLWKNGEEGKAVRFVDNGTGTLYLVTDINGSSGLLVRKEMNWDSGSKFGAKPGNTVITENKALDLTADGADMSFTGSGRYRIELSNTDAGSIYYMCAFSDWMPDLNYGALSDLENNACFKDLAASADKWIGMGIDGFRLDAVKHICGGISSYNNASNSLFLKTWYDRCNRTYKAAGHADDIFMVGEVWSSHNDEKSYYEGINSCFEFGYWPLLYKVLTSQNASSYVTTVTGFINDHKAVRPDAVTSLFMTNHDHSSQTGDGEVRAANDLGKNLAREKQAAAMMLTTEGKPFVYQGEELGYWGNSKGRGDEYLRAPVVWDASAKDCAKKGVNDKVDSDMLKGSISVETQSADSESLLNTYRSWSRLRNTYAALAEGTMTDAGIGSGGVAAWYMISGSQKLLVIHNVASSSKTVTVRDDISHPLALLGSATAKGSSLTLGANTSVVFDIQ